MSLLGDMLPWTVPLVKDKVKTESKRTTKEGEWLLALPATAATTFLALPSRWSLKIATRLVTCISPKGSGMSRGITILITGRNASTITCEFYQMSGYAHGKNQHTDKPRKEVVEKCLVYLTVLDFLLWFQAIIHPDTGKKVLMPFRMSGLFVKNNLIFDIHLLIIHTLLWKHYDMRYFQLCFCRICTFWNSNGKF